MNKHNHKKFPEKVFHSKPIILFQLVERKSWNIFTVPSVDSDTYSFVRKITLFVGNIVNEFCNIQKSFCICTLKL